MAQKPGVFPTFFLSGFECSTFRGWIAPYRKSREDRFALRLALCRGAIAGAQAIREVLPDALVHIDPLVQVMAPRERLTSSFC